MTLTDVRIVGVLQETENMTYQNNINKTLLQAYQDKEVGDIIQTQQATYFIEQCNCGQKQPVPQGVCDMRCIRCNFKFIDCG